MTLREFEGFSPNIPKDSYVDPSAVIIGQVTCGNRSGIFPGAVVRADESPIEIGDGSFVLDLALVEAPSACPVSIGDGTIISHGAALHGCMVGDSCLIGIGAIILERALIEDNCIVAAGSLVPPGMRVESGNVMMGTPARKIRKVSEDDGRILQAEIVRLKHKISRY